MGYVHENAEFMKSKLGAVKRLHRENSLKTVHFGVIGTAVK